MDWGVVGGSATLASLVTYVLKTVLDHSLKSDLESLKSTLRRAEQLEASRQKARRESYSEFWRLTERLNLFGPTDPLDLEGLRNLSAGLMKSYFASGVALEPEAKRCYFLAQEALSWAEYKKLPIQRPANEVLYGPAESTVPEEDCRREARTVQRLRKLRHAELGAPILDDSKEHSFEDLSACVDRWKREEEPSPERSWIAIQLLLSALRSRIKVELAKTGA